MFRLLVLGLVAVAFGGGVVLSTHYWSVPSEPNHKDISEKPPEGEGPADPIPEGEADFARIDSHIRENRHDQALVLCRQGARRSTGAALDALDYRAALCLEVRGEREKAFGLYAALLARSPDTRAAAGAALGQARCWLRQGKTVEARTLVNALLLRSALPANADHNLLTDASYLFAFTLAAESGPDEAPSALRPLALARTRVEIPVEPLLDWVTAEGAAADPGQPDPREGHLETRRLGNRAEEVSVTASATQERLAAFVDRLAEKCGLPVKWAAEARALAESHVVTVVVEQMPLPDLVRGLAVEANLDWELADGALTVRLPAGDPHGGAGAQRQAEMRRENASAVLRSALLTAPDHPLNLAAMVELGNLEVAAGRNKEGLAWYERAQTQNARRLPAEAFYNLAVTRLKLGDRTQARSAFYNVTDRSPGSDLALLAFLQIGRQHLEENAPNAALRPLGRALGAAPRSTTRTAAALLTAAAHLVLDNPRAAYSALAEVGPALSEDAFRRPGALLDALARYRARGSSREAANEVGDLIQALAGYRQEEPILGPVGLLLAGRAYRDLGMMGDMVAFYERTAPKLESPTGQEIAFDLGEAYYAREKWAEARRLFEAVTAGEGARAGAAELRLAALDLGDRHPDDSIRHCRHLLGSGMGDKKAILFVLGKAYAAKGDNVRAAQCFAGEVPPEPAPPGGPRPPGR